MFKSSRFSPKRFSLGVRPGMTLAEQGGFYVINWAAWTMLIGSGVFTVLNALQGNWQLFPYNVSGFLNGILAVFLLSRGHSFLALGTLCIVVGAIIFVQAVTCGNGIEVLLILFFVLGSFLMANRWWRRLSALACGAAFVCVQALHFHPSGVKGVGVGRFVTNYITGLLSLYGVIALLRTVFDGYLRAIEEKSRELEEANRAKERLFALVSHDLRGPIVNLKGSVDHFAAGRLTPEQFDEIRGTLRADLHQLHASLENILNWSAGQMNSPVPRFGPVSLRTAAGEAWGLLAAGAKEKGIAMENRMPEGAAVRADEGQLQAILRNLLANALKFTAPGGEIVLEARSCRFGEGEGWEIAVADSGVAGGTESGAVAINRALRGEKAEPDLGIGTAKERGFGLGLRLCRDFVAAQGGTIRAEMRVGGGTIVLVTFPKAAME